MKLPRFRVATVTGFPILGERTSRRSGKAQPGLSAHVLDSLHGYQLVASYRSEDRKTARNGFGHFTGRRSRGVEGALRAAQEHADRLNEIHRLVQHKERMRERRGLVG